MVATAAVLVCAQVVAWVIVKILVLRLARMTVRELVKQDVLLVQELVLAVVLVVKVVVRVLVPVAVKIVVSKSANQVVMMPAWDAKASTPVKVVPTVNAVIILGDYYVSRWICCAQRISSKGKRCYI